jgi:hypothetical protein
MNLISAVAMRVLVVLGYLISAAGFEAVTGEPVTNASLVLGGTVVAAFLSYVALRYARGAFLVRRWRRRRASITTLRDSQPCAALLETVRQSAGRAPR